LVTSGLGGKFPAGYPVARVSSVYHDPGLPYAVVKALPIAELDRSRQWLMLKTIKAQPFEKVADPAASSVTVNE